MQLLKRIGLYLVGLTFGIIILIFFLKQKNVEFNYLPNARTLKNIRVKKRLFSDDALKVMNLHQIDTTQISTILKHGDVDFSKSKPREKPCREYWINSQKLDKKISLIVTNCDSTATIKEIIIHKN